MRILFLAPQPFFQERGTTIAIDLLLKALAQRDDTVDVLTFHLGEDRDYPRIRLYRAAPPFAPAEVKPGFSWNKVYCDLFLFRDAFRMVRRNRYDLIYAVEEAGFMAMILGRYASVPYVFDMDSSMAEQLAERYRWIRPVEPILQWLETLPMRGALSVVPMCEHLAQIARRHCAGSVHVLKDVSLLGSRSSGEVEDLRRSLQIRGPMLMYVGNLKTYQGIDLMLESVAKLPARYSHARLVVIGGNDASLEKYRGKAKELGVAEQVHFVGPRPVDALGDYLTQADLLLSPRITGTNTPMKIYSYLDSGVAVVATALLTHTQVMTDEHAALTAPEPDAMADAIVRLLDDPEQRMRLAARARALVKREHSREAFRRSAHAAFSEIERRVAANGLRKRVSAEPEPTEP
ncbi:MAG: glycosyltransferase family 4 protein [Gammaproteobacteria bacterium]|nr:glycosyltransferase family 4 protein [Gammaproteobacteria bacterium]